MDVHTKTRLTGQVCSRGLKTARLLRYNSFTPIINFYSLFQASLEGFS